MRQVVKKKNMIILIGDAATVIIVLCAWMTMFSGADPAHILSSAGVSALKYFTIDSNLLMAFAAVVNMSYTVREHKHSHPVPVWVGILRYIAVVSVMLTFGTTFLFLVRLYGFRAMIAGVNFYLHLIVPLMSFFLFLMVQPTRRTGFGMSFIAVLPMLIYGMCYMGNILVNGRSSANDWYGFARWGPGMYLPVILIVTGLAWILAAVLWILGGGLSKGDRPLV